MDDPMKEVLEIPQQFGSRTIKFGTANIVHLVQYGYFYYAQAMIHEGEIITGLANPMDIIIIKT